MIERILLGVLFMLVCLLIAFGIIYLIQIARGKR